VAAFADDDIWLLVDTKARRIEVKKGDHTIETLDKIAIGRAGAGMKMRRGDNITPFGSYKIGWIGEKTSFRRFFGLTYPSVEDAEKALAQHTIDETTYYQIVSAHMNHQLPPQDTPLGGQIGIHGLGSADIQIHRIFDWTHGCIALTNEQIDRLSRLVDTGTVVKIK
jgi:murein L,D-transpeptidase YafK